MLLHFVSHSQLPCFVSGSKLTCSKALISATVQQLNRYANHAIRNKMANSSVVCVGYCYTQQLAIGTSFDRDAESYEETVLLNIFTFVHYLGRDCKDTTTKRCRVLTGV